MFLVQVDSKKEESMTLQEILESVKSSSVSVEERQRESLRKKVMKKWDMRAGYTKARPIFAEVIYCSNKADEHLLNIFERLYRRR